MKIFFFSLFTFLAGTLSAQRFNRPVTNDDLKAIIGNWSGSVHKTDTAYNNALLKFKGDVEIVPDGDSLILQFKYIDAKGNEFTEKTSLYVFNDNWMMRIGGVEFEITSMRRRGYTQVLVAERQAYENYKLMDFRQQFIFAPNELKIIREARFIDMDAYFIRYRSVFNKK